MRGPRSVSGACIHALSAASCMQDVGLQPAEPMVTPGGQVRLDKLVLVDSCAGLQQLLMPGRTGLIPARGEAR